MLVLKPAAAYNSALISAGAKVNAKEDKYGQTPLHLVAANNSNPDVVKALISAGAKVNAKDKYDNAARHNSNPDVVMAKDDKYGLKPRCSKSPYQCRQLRLMLKMKWFDSFAFCSTQQLKPRCSKSSYQCRR